LSGKEKGNHYPLAWSTRKGTFNAEDLLVGKVGLSKLGKGKRLAKAMGSEKGVVGSGYSARRKRVQGGQNAVEPMGLQHWGGWTQGLHTSCMGLSLSNPRTKVRKRI